MATTKDIKFVESVLRNYRAMQAEKDNLLSAIQLVELEKDESIRAEQLQASTINDMPGIPTDGLKLPQLPRAMSEEYLILSRQQQKMNSRLRYISAVLQATDLSLESLDSYDRGIVQLFYIDRVGLKQIADTMSLNPNIVWKKKRGLVVYMSKSLAMFNISSN